MYIKSKWNKSLTLHSNWKELWSFTEIEVLGRGSSNNSTSLLFEHRFNCYVFELSVVVWELELITFYDLQEFSKLFVSMLEERLSHQSSPLVKKIVNEQFCGKYSYVTK
jgi:hypothetical protein